MSTDTRCHDATRPELGRAAGDDGHEETAVQRQARARDRDDASCGRRRERRSRPHRLDGLREQEQPDRVFER
jgi:hypothetical protein